MRREHGTSGRPLVSRSHTALAATRRRAFGVRQRGSPVCRIPMALSSPIVTPAPLRRNRSDETTDLALGLRYSLDSRMLVALITGTLNSVPHASSTCLAAPSARCRVSRWKVHAGAARQARTSRTRARTCRTKAAVQTCRAGSAGLAAHCTPGKRARRAWRGSTRSAACQSTW